MNPKMKLALYVGAAALAIGALYWISQNQNGGAATTSLTPDNTNTDAGSSQPITFNIPGLPAPVEYTSPGSTLLFNVYNEQVQPGGAQGSVTGGTGSPDGSVTGPCNCPAGGAQSFGSTNDAAAAMGPLASVLTQFIPRSISPWQIAEYGGSNPIQTALNEAIAQGHQLEQAANDFWAASATG